MSASAVPPASRFALNIRAKLAIVALVLLVIPWVGYTYVKSMEKLLRENQVQTVVASARAVATALQDRPRLLELRTPSTASGAAVEPRPVSEEIQLLVTGLARAGSRIWVVDSRLRLIATAGSIDVEPAPAGADLAFGPLERLVRTMLRFVFERVHRPVIQATEEIIPNDVVFGGRELERALDGTPSWRTRMAPGGRTAILTAVNPIWIGDHVVGAVIVEESTQAIVSFSNRALEQLVAVTLIAFGVGALTLFFFASSLSSRLRKLRDEADNAIDSQGRVRGLVAGEHARDEIGDLSRGFSTVLGRLAEYNAYLENLAARLTHELRTPIAVVRSSLDNMKLQEPAAEPGVYLARAEDGLNRLETILTRMSEATRLEQTVRSGEREEFDAKNVVAGCVEGYAAAYPTQRFALSLPDGPVTLSGAPDLFAQMLDKLAANAVDFATGDDPVQVDLTCHDDSAVLHVSNTGPLLPAEMKERLFESMVSVRRERAAHEPHLGLGLYIVREIAEFHGGSANASDRADGNGVVFELRFPLAR
ncbi:MAG: ATP-binding protein [Burkholderiales bacterium]